MKQLKRKVETMEDLDVQMMKMRAIGYLSTYKDLVNADPDNIITSNTFYYLEGLYECIFDEQVSYPTNED